MQALIQRAELAKLAGLLNVPVEDLSYLDDFDPETLRAFREQVTDMIFDTDRDKLERPARVVSRVPARILARIAPRWVPPRLAARGTELLAPKKAVKLVSRLPATYVADCAVHIDARRYQPYLAVLPPDVVGQVARILGERGDYVTMARLVLHLDQRAISVGISALPDDVIVLTAFYLEDVGRTDELVALLPDSRFDQLFTVIHERGLWFHIVALLANMGREQRSRFAEVIMHLDQDRRNGFIGTINGHDAWDVLLGFFRVLSPDGQAYFCSLIAQRPASVRESLIRTAVQESLWGDLSGIVLAMPDDIRDEMLDSCARIGEETGHLGLQELTRQLREVIVMPAQPSPEPQDR